MNGVQSFRESSTAGRPDLDWSQVRETVRMLHLSIAQIGHAMADGDQSINALASSFTTMMEQVRRIESVVASLPQTPEFVDVHGAIAEEAGHVHQGMQSAIIAFQFYDKLSQRLSHVTESLHGLSSLVSDSNKLFNPGEWVRLQQLIRSRYTMREEQEMFDALLRGATIEEAIAFLEGQAEASAANDDDSIELF